MLINSKSIYTFRLLIALPLLLLEARINRSFANPPLEVYGNCATIRVPAISPEGKQVAFIGTTPDGKDLFVNINLETGRRSGSSAERAKARSVRFLSEQYVIISASDTTRYRAYRKYEFDAAIALDVKNDKATVLLAGATEDLYPVQSGLSRITAPLPDNKAVLMSAYMGQYSKRPSLDLLRVDLKNGRGRRYMRGNSNTRDWIAGRNGNVLAREDYDNENNLFRVLSRQDNQWKEIYAKKTRFLPFSLVGSIIDESALVVVDDSNEGFSTVKTLSFDGTLSQPIFQRSNKEIYRLLNDNSRHILGVEFAGPQPSYDVFDLSLKRDIDTLMEMAGGLSVSIRDWSSDMQKLLVYISGSRFSPKYFIFDRRKKSLASFAKTHPKLNDNDIGGIYEIKYRARDFYEIPAILTTPPTLEPGEQKLPLIVMPHGGPQSHDTVGFDWLAQFFANRGYLVFQPNFRGSSGYGKRHTEAGYGEWGGLMQDDVTDGVKRLIENGWADKERVCIIGGSYGGYAALAGGAFTPELYKCVAAIAPISDLVSMMLSTRRESSEGEDSFAYRYWTRFIGDRRKDKAKLEAVSPVNFASSFQAPVLLIHGRDDTVVRIDQSARMHRALKAAGKSVQFVRLKGEDHYLSKSETRVETLRALAQFVETNIGAAASPTSRR
ncbi:MAG: alpha/beta fold hydrolase [Pseudomonadota bacterium]